MFLDIPVHGDPKIRELLPNPGVCVLGLLKVVRAVHEGVNQLPLYSICKTVSQAPCWHWHIWDP